MKKETKTAMRNVSKLVLLAQVASDAGKGYKSSAATNAKEAVSDGYWVKPEYIEAAIKAFEKNKHVLRNIVEVGIDPYEGVVLFNFKGFGQVSFHVFEDFFSGHYELYFYKVRWNGILGGSVKTAEKLASYFNLPHYFHSERHELRSKRKKKARLKRRGE